MRKVKRTFMIEEEVDKELRKLIMRKYKRYSKGLLSAEVNEAIKRYIQMESAAHTHKSESSFYSKNIDDRVLKVWLKVLDRFKERHGHYPCEILLTELKHIIGVVRGTDKRTVKKWIENFVEYGLFKIHPTGRFGRVLYPDYCRVENHG